MIFTAPCGEGGEVGSSSRSPLWSMPRQLWWQMEDKVEVLENITTQHLLHFHSSRYDAYIVFASPQPPPSANSLIPNRVYRHACFRWSLGSRSKNELVLEICSILNSRSVSRMLGYVHSWMSAAKDRKRRWYSQANIGTYLFRFSLRAIGDVSWSFSITLSAN
jgi:hypothetical protein